MAEAAEKFREEHDNLSAELTTPERTKSVCEVCGVFVNSTDNEQRRLVCSWLSTFMLVTDVFPGNSDGCNVSVVRGII